MTYLFKTDDMPMTMQEPREYRDTSGLTTCVCYPCDRQIDRNAFPGFKGGAYVKNLGWVCTGHYLKCVESEE